MKGLFVFVWELLKIVILAAIIVVPIRYFLFQPFFVKGQSMESSFEDGDYLIVDELSYRFREPQRGEVIVFKYPNNPSKRYIKRIIGLPGETVVVKDGKVAVFDKWGSRYLDESEYLPSSISTPGNVRVSLEEGEYFVLGDNRSSSSDSRSWGPLPEEDIVGRAVFRAWPFIALAKINVPDYQLEY